MGEAVANHNAFDPETELPALAAGPAFVRELLAEIPAELFKKRRRPGKWTIHEHAVHLTLIDEVMTARVELFRTQAEPAFVPYQPGEGEAAIDLMDLDLEARLKAFEASRPRLVAAFRALGAGDWQKRGLHPEYILYTPRIMLRHLVMHEHLHGYRIEELWLTRDGFLG